MQYFSNSNLGTITADGLRTIRRINKSETLRWERRWSHICIALSFSQNEYKFYLNGKNVLDDGYIITPVRKGLGVKNKKK